MKRNTQLKLNDRIRIETYLEEQIPIKKICKALNVSKQTIYRYKCQYKSTRSVQIRIPT